MMLDLVIVWMFIGTIFGIYLDPYCDKEFKSKKALLIYMLMGGPLTVMVQVIARISHMDNSKVSSYFFK